MEKRIGWLGSWTAAVVLAVTGMAGGESIYIAQNGQGSNSGADAANAHAAAWFNTAANWGAGAGKISPGDTARLCGTLTTALTVQASGTAGNPITVLFEPDAKMTSPAWPTNWWGGGAITVQQKDYITIDGGTNGIIENTDNGTALGHQQNSAGVGGANANYFTVKNLTVRNIYVRTSTAELNDMGAGIQNVCTQASSITNFLVTHCTINDAYIGINSDYGAGCSDYEFSYNTIYNCNWGGNAGDRSASATLTGLSVHHNRLYNWANWDEPAGNRYHHNGFYGWAESGGHLSNVTVYANTVGPNFGRFATSGVFFSGNTSNILIYNNLFLENPNDGPANGLVTASGNIFNNTFIGQGAGIAICGGGNVKNNLAIDVATFIFCAYGRELTADYNFGYDLNPGMQYCVSPNSSGVFYTFAQWQGLGYDVHGSNVNPLLNNEYKLTAGSPAIGQGTDLSAFFTTDFDGIARPQGSGWDVGAYEYYELPIADLRFAIDPAPLPLLPNPIKAALLDRYRQAAEDVRIRDLAGKPVDGNSLMPKGVYFVQSGPGQPVQKIVVGP